MTTAAAPSSPSSRAEIFPRLAGRCCGDFLKSVGCGVQAEIQSGGLPGGDRHWQGVLGVAQPDHSNLMLTWQDAAERAHTVPGWFW